MKNKNLYDKTIAILVKAYMNDTLKPGSYCGCAVGNLISSANGCEITSVEGLAWFDIIKNTTSQPTTLEMIEKATNQILSTGYNFPEITKIEQAFEGDIDEEYQKETEVRMYDGLMRVLDILGEIHEVSQQVTEETKLLFAK